MLGHVRSASKPTVIVTVVFDQEHQRFHQKFAEQYLRRAAKSCLVLSHANTDVQIVLFLRKQRRDREERKERLTFVSSGFTIDEQLISTAANAGADVSAQRDESC